MSQNSTTAPYAFPDAQGHFGPYGGVFVAETLFGALDELKRQMESTTRSTTGSTTAPTPHQEQH